jgi:hypothetical protein
MLRFTLRLSVLVLVGIPFWVSCGGGSPDSNTIKLHSTCQAAGELTCYSSSVPQLFTNQDALGTCCYALDSSGNVNRGATEGFYCAYGANDSRSGGCYASINDARSACPDAPSIVQCSL